MPSLTTTIAHIRIAARYAAALILPVGAATMLRDASPALILLVVVVAASVWSSIVLTWNTRWLTVATHIFAAATIIAAAILDRVPGMELWFVAAVHVLVGLMWMLTESQSGLLAKVLPYASLVLVGVAWGDVLWSFQSNAVVHGWHLPVIAMTVLAMTWWKLGYRTRFAGSEAHSLETSLTKAIAAHAVVVCGVLATICADMTTQRWMRPVDESALADYMAMCAKNQHPLPLQRWEQIDHGVSPADMWVGGSPTTTNLATIYMVTGNREANQQLDAILDDLAVKVSKGECNVRIVLMPTPETAVQEAACYADLSAHPHDWVQALRTSWSTHAIGTSATKTSETPELRARRSRAMRLALADGVTTPPAITIQHGETRALLQGDHLRRCLPSLTGDHAVATAKE